MKNPGTELTSDLINFLKNYTEMKNLKLSDVQLLKMVS